MRRIYIDPAMRGAAAGLVIAAITAGSAMAQDTQTDVVRAEREERATGQP